MEIFSSKIFWGVIVLIIGLGLIINGIFKIDLPITKIIFGLVFIWLGVRFLMGDTLYRKVTNTNKGDIGKNVNVRVDNENLKPEYNAVFSRSVIDLGGLPANSGNYKIKVNAVFGSADVLVPAHIRPQVNGTAVFGSVNTPGASASEVGVTSVIEIEANAVFGQITITRK